MFSKLSKAIVGHPWRVISVWIILAIGIIGFSPDLLNYTTSSAGAGLSNSYQSVQAQSIATKYFPASAYGSGSIVVTASNGAALQDTDITSIQGLVSGLTAQKIPCVTSVTTSPKYVSSNKKADLVAVVYSQAAGSTCVNNASNTINSDTADYLRGTGLVAGQVGNASISVDTTNAYATAQTILEIFTVLAIVLLLALVFRSIIIAILPVVLITIIHLMAAGVTAWLAEGFGFQVGTSLDPLLTVVMFGVGTDYIIFLLFRYREDIIENANEGHTQILEKALSKIGVVVMSAAATVITAFAALLVASLQALTTLAPGLIVGVFFMMLAGLTLVPAIFRLLGKHLFFPYQPRKPKRVSQSERVAHFVMKRRVLTIVMGLVVFVGLALGLFGFKTTYNTLSELPTSTPSLVAYNTLAANYPPGLLGPTYVYVEGTSSTPINETSVANLSTKLSTTKGVESVLGTTYSPTTSPAAAQIAVVLSDNPYSTQALDNVQNSIEPAADGAIPGNFIAVGGTSSQLVDVRSAMTDSLKHVLPLALVIVAIILALLLFAIVAPLYIVLGVIILYISVVGVTMLVFVTGLGYNGVDFTVPLIAYLFVMAVGSDYNILMAARIREEHNAGLPPKEAAKQAILTGAPSVTAAGLILAATFASLLFTNIQILEEIGLAVIAAVLLASYVLTSKMLPAVTSLQGNSFWWPKHKITGAPPEAPEAQKEPESVS